MIYISRALHFFIKMVVVLTVAFGLMYLMGWMELDGSQFWDMLFDSTKGAIVIALVILVSAAYPLLSFTRVAIHGDFDRERNIIDRVVVGMGYKSVLQDADRAEYRVKSIAKKLFNQCDDRIVIARDGSFITVSGLKKEVLRIESLFMQYRANFE